MNPLALLGPVGSLAATLGLIVTLAGGAYAIVREHDAKVLAVASAASQHEQDQRTIEGLSKANALALARNAGTAKLKEAIHAAPPTSACADSPSIRALVIGLRGAQVAAAATPAGHSLDLSSRAPGAR